MATQKEIQDFINAIAPIIQAEAKRRGYKFPSAIIAQACCESAYGTSSLGWKYHNYFGMKCGRRWTGKSVNLKTKEEYTVGTLTTMSDNFRVYDDMLAGVVGYFDFINTSRYANLKDAKSPREYLELIKADGYATSSSYVGTNMNIVDKLNLTRFDETAYRPITPDVVGAVIDGRFGNGNARALALRNEGFNPEEVQAKVNELYKISKELIPFKQKCGEYWECVLKF